MIFVFGAILMGVRLGLDKNIPQPGLYYAPDYEIGIAGKAAIQALAAVKSGARSAVVGQTGDDHYGKNILLRLRQHGVVTSAVARHETVPTGMFIQIGRKPGQTILVPGASAKASHEQIPSDVLNEGAVLLLQDEFPAAQNIPLLTKAKQKGARVILNCGVYNDIQDYDLGAFDYVIAAQSHDALIDHVGKKAPSKLVVLGERGACSAQGFEIASPQIEGMDWVDDCCAQDAFCGSFAAGVQAGEALEAALLRASVACVLTAGKKGGYKSLPYPDEIRDALTVSRDQTEKP